MQPWYFDTQMLAAGNARGFRKGDPDVRTVSPPGPTTHTGHVAGDLRASHLSELRLIDLETRTDRTVQFSGTVTVRVDGREVVLREGSSVIVSGRDFELVEQVRHGLPELEPAGAGALDGDLDAAAARLGVDVADLVRLRRELGPSHRRRRPSLIARMFGRKA